MKILTPEEEQAHNKVVLEGGLLGGVIGLSATTAAVFGASRRFHFVRQLSLPFRAFLVVGPASGIAVIFADRYSREFEKKRHGDADYKNQSEQALAELSANKPMGQRFKTFVSEQRYPIVFGSWVVGMGLAGFAVGRSPHLSGQQKLVQARVYAQSLTMAVLIASFALESNDLRAGKGRWETVKIVDPNDPEHKRIIEKKIHHESYTGEDQWMDMIEAEEQKMKSRGESVRTRSKKAKKDAAEDQEHEESKAKSK